MGIENALTQAAAENRKRGFGIVWLVGGEKKPTRRGWTLKSQEVGDYSPGANLGLMTGVVSGDLVCIDLDSPQAVALADSILPPTGMIDGRVCKPRSHRWYIISDI